jgi:cation diffusion facilitator CzcD-associated flavoprotein CzcO
MDERQVVIVGAGPAGLASAAELARLNISATVLERGEAIGASWRGRYDRLRLNSSRWFSALPGARWPRSAGAFPKRDDVVAYLEDYARFHHTEVRLNTSVDRIDRDGGGWRLRTSTGDLHSEHVIVASGYAHTPHIPGSPGRDAYDGLLIHAAAYRNPEPFRQSDVLVVGAGCSAMEIAYDLVDAGVERVRVAVRTPPNFLIRSPIGPLLGRTLMKLGPRRADRVMKLVRRMEIGDLTEYGLPAPEEGIFARLQRLEVAPAIVDKEVIEAIKERRIEIVAGVETLDESGVGLADGTRVEPDAVIAATGYRSGLEPVVGHLGVLDERGVPHVRGGAEAVAGLRFVGYVPRPAQIGLMGAEAKLAAEGIAAGGLARQQVHDTDAVALRQARRDQRTVTGARLGFDAHQSGGAGLR